MQFYCRSNQEVLDTVIQAYKVAESVSLPCMVCMDGVYLSYLAESVDIPEQKKVDEYLPPYKVTLVSDNRYRMFVKDPSEAGDYEQVDFMTNRYQLQKWESRCIDTAIKSDNEFKILFGRTYPPVEAYRCEDAEVVVILMGSAVGTCRYVIDSLREKSYKVGLIKLKMFRPFPTELIRKAVSGKKKLAIIDRDLSPGQGGIINQEVKWALYTNLENQRIPIYGFISGLGGADISPELIEKAILFTLKENPPISEVIWLGRVKETGDYYDKNCIKIS
jgi:pyruvate/2-oxoacid:ferredoxin oxidoreductase alpha subunit